MKNGVNERKSFIFRDREVILLGRTDVDFDKYITRQQAADYMKISIRSVDKIINSNIFDGKLKVGNRTLINKKELDRYIEKCIV